MDISVIIPSYNRREILRHCLQALLQQTLAADAYEIIVVDDGSTDGTPDMVEALQSGARCRLVLARQSHRGPAAARNHGLRLSQGWLTVFIDSDILVRPDFLAAHRAAHDRPLLIAHGPVIHTEDLEHATETPMRWTDHSRAFFATGNVSVERRWLFEAGLFDETFREYGWEDLELGRRLRRLGLKGIPCPQAPGYHYHPPFRLEQLPAQLEKERQRGHTALYYYRKHPVAEVRYATLVTPAALFLDRLLFAADWPCRPGTQALLRRCSAKGWSLPLRFLTRLALAHAYMAGVREALAEEARQQAAAN
ncbi:MAG: glycosyltransferase family 2 protein [Firmicutes bacterium]|nr:glycosyltransferase family 2 protein [Bacillota bacterium]